MSDTQLKFRYICEESNSFLSLFPHRFDYIYAPHPNPGESPAWQTETRHPLSDRLIQQNAYLYGVRFGAETNYCLLDIDIRSIYHPQQDPFAISRIVAALEPLGLVSYVVCTSSYSGGLHLYFPFQQLQSSWQLAIALACLLENAGFKLQPGQLELFPNPRPYRTDNKPSLFNAHRLPLQIGSYLLNEVWQPIWSDSQAFVNQWTLAQRRNDINGILLKQTLRQARRKHLGISGKAEKFINDLNAEIEVGWTGYGQTNRLLGRITMRAYIFHHILSGGEPLQGNTLISEIVETARSLPGYEEWCRHQHEINQRAEEWARCIESSHYFHFGDQTRTAKSAAQDPELVEAIEQAPSWNERQAAVTRDRIRKAIADLLENNALPARPTARFQALLKYGIGGGSLYRHRDLWHPSYFDTDINTVQDSLEAVELSTEIPSVAKLDSQRDALARTYNRQDSPSLLTSDGGDNASGKAFDDRSSFHTPTDASNAVVAVAVQFFDSELLPEVGDVQQVLFEVQASQAVFQEATTLAQQQYRHLRSEAVGQRYIDRMQRFLDSGDPILIAEAMAWVRVNPGILQVDPLQLSLLIGDLPGCVDSQWG